MPYTVSLVLQHLGHFDSSLAGVAVHGANLSISRLIKQFAGDDRVAALEIFLPPSVMVKQDELAQAAAAVLPARRQGRGVLRFYPIQALPETWSDGQERILWSIDPEWLPRDRYLRDKFSKGPMAIACDTHAFGYHPLWIALSRYLAAPPVPYDSIVALSTAYAEATRKSILHLTNKADRHCRVDVVPRGVSLIRFTPADESRKTYARQILNLPAQANIALYFGRLTPNAKADLMPLVRAFAEVAGQTDILILAGMENAPGYALRLQQLGNELGLANRLRITTEVEPNLRSLYFSSADLFVFPGDTIQEALGNTVLEAMASGLPVLASDWDGFKDMVVDDVTGYLVPTYFMPATERIEALSPASNFLSDYLYLAQSVWVDTTILKDKLKELLTNPELRSKMGQAGRQRVEAEFGWSHCMDRLVGIWDQQLTLARQETDEDIRARRRYADRLGFPTPYLEMAGHYATAVIDPQIAQVCLTKHGELVVRQSAKLEFYDETLAVIRPEIMDGLFKALGPFGDYRPLAAIATRIAATTRATEDEVLFHASLLVKRDVVHLLHQHS